jgi:hypothetical protein
LRLGSKRQLKHGYRSKISFSTRKSVSRSALLYSIVFLIHGMSADWPPGDAFHQKLRLRQMHCAAFLAHTTSDHFYGDASCEYVEEFPGVG